MKDKFVAASLGPRIATAVIAASAVLAVGYFLPAIGLEIIVAIVVALSVREFLRMAFLPVQAPRVLKIWFAATAALLLLGLLFSPEPLLVFALCSSLFLAVSIWITRNRISNERLLPALASSTVGFLYCVVFPTFSVYTLELEHGKIWFALHLLIVFAGDVFAYFGGIWIGGKKLMPEISPKKTVAGAFAGLLGSVGVGATAASLLLPGLPLWQSLFFSLVVGFAAQMGDLFVSLFKRVAQIKDSGHLLPGHGGILDRIDGILITCPFIYAFALIGERIV